MEIYGGNRLPVFSAGAFSRKALRTSAYAHRSRKHRGGARTFAGRNCRSDNGNGRKDFSVQSRMKNRDGRARPPGAPSRLSTDGSAIRFYLLLLALFLASCAAPDTRHHIVISTREQKLALLDRNNVMAIFPVSTSKFGLGDL